MFFNVKNWLTLLLFCLCVSNILYSQSCLPTDSLCYTSNVFPTVNFQIQKSFDSQANTNVYQTPLVADINGDCIPEIIMSGTSNIVNNPRLTSGIHVVDPIDGTTIVSFPTANYAWSSPTSFCVGDVDSDGMSEIIIAAADHTSNPINVRGKLVCYNFNGTIKWISNANFGVNVNWGFAGTPGLADFNQDGIPEVYIYNEIFNAVTGVKLADGGNNGVGVANATSLVGSVSITIAGQLDADPNDLELAAGYTVYKTLITNTNGMVGNSMTPINIAVDNALRDGFTSIADINQDGQLDIIVASEGAYPNGKLYVYDIQAGASNLIASISLQSGGGTFSHYVGAPFVGDFNNSGNPGIAMTRSYRLYGFEYDGTTTLDQLWSLTTNDESGATGVTMFDFDQSGSQEIVYRDMSTLSIFDATGAIPVVLASFSCSSHTGIERPIVADIDGTGTSKICTTCGLNSTSGKLSVFAPPPNGDQWAPSRKVWNQYAYHVLNINDDMTIPQNQLNNSSYINGAFNNFYAQASLVDDNGGYIQQAINLSIEVICLNYDPVSDEYTLDFNITNAANASATAPIDIEISFFDGDPEGTGTFLGSIFTSDIIAPGDTLFGLNYQSSNVSTGDLYVVINTSGMPSGGVWTPDDFHINECDYTNNSNQPIVSSDYTIINQTICQGDTIVFNNQVVADSGVYYANLINTNGCDSIIQLDLSLDGYSGNLPDTTVCGYFIGNLGDTIVNSGTYQFEYQTTSGCDSILLVDVLVLDTIVYVESCDSYLSPSGTHQWTQSGLYVDTIPNSQNCDSILYVDLVITNSSFDSIQVQTCPPFISPSGNSLSSTGFYFDTIQNVNGCDSVVFIDLQIIHDTTYTEFLICDGDFVTVDGIVLDTSGQYTFNYVTSGGCDSTDIVLLDVNELYYNEIDTIVCDDFIAPDNSVINESGIYEFVYQDSQNCDSTIAYNLSIIKDTLTVSVCNSYTSPSGDYVWTTSGIYEDYVTPSYNCDSVLIIDLTILEVSYSEIEVSDCDNYTSPSGNYTWNQSGVYFDTLTNTNGCDSIISIILNINPSSEVVEFAYFLCNPITLYEAEISESGNYQFYFENTNGCDSIINYSVQFYSPYSDECLDSASIDDIIIYVPNTFTPDGDKHNEVFSPVLNGNIDASSYQMEIYNRWGELIFETYNIDKGWNGSYNNQIAPDGTYIWKIYVNKATNDEKQMFVGHVNLLR